MLLTKIIIIVISCYEVVQAYNFACSDVSQWKKRAQERCVLDNQYHCILDTNLNITREFCLKPDFLPEGFRSTYSGNRDAIPCSNQRFAPFVSSTSDRFDCVYQKSSCAGEGQVVFDRGSSIDGVTCRCDFRRGYGFLVKPRHKCYCNPRMEDCSCYQQKCASEYVLSTDYVCVRQNSKDVVLTCPDIITIRDDNDKTTQQSTDLGDFRVPPLKTYSDSAGVVVIVLMILLFIIISASVILIWKQSTICRQNIDGQEFLEEDTVNDAPLTPRSGFIPHYVSDLSFIPELQRMLDKKSLLILKGRKGTGKTTIAKHLEHKYKEEGYDVFQIKDTDDVAKSDFFKDKRGSCVLIFDDILDNHESFETFRAAIDKIEVNGNKERTIVIATLKQTFGELVNITDCIKDTTIERDVVFDLDRKESYSAIDKKNIFWFHMTKNNIIFTENDYATDDETCIIGRQLFNAIIKEETFLGFPYMIALFCSNRDHIKLGLHYFRQPPLCLISNVDQMREHGNKEPTKACQYGILVAVLLYKITSTNQNDIGKIEKLVKDFFASTLKENWTLSEEFIKQQIKTLCPDFIYNVNNEQKLQFSHIAVRHAVMISHFELRSAAVMEECNILDVLLFLRPHEYKPLNGEVVFTEKICENRQFAQRVTDALLQNERSTQTVIDILQKYTVTDDGLDFLILIEKKLKHQLPVNISAMTMLFGSVGKCTRKHALKCSNMEIYMLNLAWEYLSSKISGRFSNDLIQDILNNDSIHKVLETKMDNGKNSLLHYFVLWNGPEENNIYCKLLSKLDRKSGNKSSVADAFKVFKLENCDKHSPVHFAAYLGRYHILSELKKVLNIRHKRSLGDPTKVADLADKPLMKSLRKEGKIHAKTPVIELPKAKIKISFEWNFIQFDSSVCFGDDDDYKNIKAQIKNI